jgi:hypothetical protein
MVNMVNMVNGDGVVVKGGSIEIHTVYEYFLHSFGLCGLDGLGGHWWAEWPCENICTVPYGADTSIPCHYCL